MKWPMQLVQKVVSLLGKPSVGSRDHILVGWKMLHKCQNCTSKMGVSGVGGVEEAVTFCPRGTAIGLILLITSLKEKGLK